MAARHTGKRSSRPPSRSCPPVAEKLQKEPLPIGQSVHIAEYRSAEGRIPYRLWLERLWDERAVRRIEIRVDRLRRGLLGDTRSVGGGVFESRVHYGPGYHIYWGQDGPRLILLLCGGDKSSQRDDIGEAHGHWKNYKANRPKRPS